MVAGFSSAAFLASLNWATDERLAHPWFLWLLPLGGLGIGLVYHHHGKGTEGGNNLVLEQIHEPTDWLPRRMPFLVLAASVVTQLFGGSAGREGAAVQMAAGLTDTVSRTLRVRGLDRQMMLVTAVAGGFGSVFGVPLSGCVFALEVQTVGRMRYDAMVPALTAALVGDRVVRALGIHHAPMPVIGPVDIDPALLIKVAVAGVAFGLAGTAFTTATHLVERALRAAVSWPPLRPVVGGFAVIGLTYLVGNRDYNGLSLPLIESALTVGASVAVGAFALKLVFTAVTLGSGFKGGEVTPLLVIGATLGATLAGPLGVPGPLLAAVGLVAIFAGAANVPLASTIMAVELFGGDALVLYAVGCISAYLCSARGIYPSQRAGDGKAPVAPTRTSP